MSKQEIEGQLNEFFFKIASGDTNAMRQAEDQSKQWIQHSFPMFLFCLACYTANQNNSESHRSRAATLLHQNLFAHGREENSSKIDRWLNRVPTEAKNQIRSLLMQTMTHPEDAARRTASHAIARIALIEIPNGQFLDFVPTLIQNVLDVQSSTPQVREPSLDCLGIITEEIDPILLRDHTDGILSAIITGMKNEGEVLIQRKACLALFSALCFCVKNFDKPNERKIIMDTVIACCTVNDAEVSINAYRILNDIAYMHYDKLKDHMQAIFAITLQHITNASESVAKQAIEFWCTLCDEEINLADEMKSTQDKQLSTPSRHLENYVRGASQHLIQALFQALVRKDSPDIDPDELTLSFTAGVCLSLVSQNISDAILEFTVPFIEQHIMSSDWKFREASIFTFGTILDGPTELDNFIRQICPLLMEKHMKDKVDAIQDAATWTLSRIVKMHHKTVLDQAEPILLAFASALNSSPRVSASACWGLHHMASSFAEEEHNPFKKYFGDIVRALLLTADRVDWDEFHLRVAAYESLNVMLAYAPQGTDHMLGNIAEVLVKKLEDSFNIQLLSKDDMMELTDLQSLLCGAIQVTYNKVGVNMNVFSDRVMTCLLRILSDNRSNDVHEDSFLAISAVCNTAGAEFTKYMESFKHLLFASLQNIEAYNINSIVVGVVGDITRAIKLDILPYCDKFIRQLLDNLQNCSLERSVKPIILFCFGDIASVIKSHFTSYANDVLNMLRQACQTVIDNGELDAEDIDLIDYMNSLQEGILVAYSGILQGLKKNDNVYHHVDTILQLVAYVAINSFRSIDLSAAAVGVINDLVVAFGVKIKPAVSQPFVLTFIRETRQTEIKELVHAAEFAMEAINSI